MKNILDNSQRAKTTITCFYILLVAYILMLISDFMEYQLLSKGSFGYAEADANDMRQLAVYLLNFIAQVILIVVFIQWFRRAFHNLHKAGIKNLNSSEGWAAGAWFVPIMSLFRPYQIMKNIWTETKNYIRNNSTENETELDSTEENTSDLSLIGWWWATWLITSISSNISAQISRKANTIDEFTNSSLLSLVSDISGIVCIIIVIKMVKESQKDQDKFFRIWSNKETSSSFEISGSDEILD